MISHKQLLVLGRGKRADAGKISFRSSLAFAPFLRRLQLVSGTLVKSSVLVSKSIAYNPNW